MKINSKNKSISNRAVKITTIHKPGDPMRKTSTLNLDLNTMENVEKENMDYFVRKARNMGTSLAIKDMFGDIVNGRRMANQNLSNMLVNTQALDTQNEQQNLIEEEEEEVFSQASSFDDISSSSDDTINNFRMESIRKGSRRLQRAFDFQKKSLVALSPKKRKHRKSLRKNGFKFRQKSSKKLEAAKEKKKKTKKSCLIKLDGRFKIFWDNLSIFLIIYIAAFSPFKISFTVDGEYPKWDSFDLFIDFLFLMDIVLTFFTPIYLKHELITSHRLIAHEYFKLWFWIDLVSIIPFQRLFNMLSLNQSSLLKLTKMPRLYRLVKISKLIRAMKMKRKGNTFVGKILRRLVSGESLLANIMPLWLGGALIAYIFACVWHFIAVMFIDPTSWIIRYDYMAEPTHDKFWASLYYIYSTMTTTGYGDIVPGNKTEYLQTVCFMAVGVTFHSIIYSTILRKIDEHQKTTLTFIQKKEYLSNLRFKEKLMPGEVGKKIYKEMLVLLDEVEKLSLYAERVPKFKNVRPKDVKELKLQVCERDFRFDKISFFKKLPKKLWLRFFEKMEKRYYNIGDLIYDKGSVASHFFVLRKGKVFFMQSEEKDGSFPFMEVDSYFGEFELFEERKRRWTVMARSAVVVYAIKKLDFFKFFKEPKYREPFLHYMTWREREFNKADRECGRAIRRAQRAQEKLEKVKKEALKNTLKSISKAKRHARKMGDEHWSEGFKKMRNKKLEEQLEKEKKLQIEKALKRMESLHKDKKIGIRKLKSKVTDRRGAVGVNVKFMEDFKRDENFAGSVEKLDVKDVDSVQSLDSRKASSQKVRFVGLKEQNKKDKEKKSRFKEKNLRIKVKEVQKPSR